MMTAAGGDGAEDNTPPQVSDSSRGEISLGTDWNICKNTEKKLFHLNGSNTIRPVRSCTPDAWMQ